MFLVSKGNNPPATTNRKEATMFFDTQLAIAAAAARQAEAEKALETEQH